MLHDKDDQRTVLVLSTSQIAPSETLLVDHGALSAARARGELAADLRRRGLPPTLVEDAVLVLSEILSNAVRHARPLPESNRLRLRWHVDRDGVDIEVTDGGASTRPRILVHGRTNTTGRGLGIVAALTSEWGVAEQDATTTVWARLARPIGGRFPSRTGPDN